jgi:hypothetical protein
MVENKMAAKFGGHFVKTIRKPDFFVQFSNGGYHLKAGPDIFSLA